MFGRSVFFGEFLDTLGLHPTDISSPLGRAVRDVVAQCVSPEGMLLDECVVLQVFAEDNVGDSKCQCGIGAWSYYEALIRCAAGFALAYIDGHHSRASLMRLGDMSGGVGLAGLIRTPLNNQFCVGAHVFFGIDLHGAGQAEAQSAEPPADHGAVPDLESGH